MLFQELGVEHCYLEQETNVASDFCEDVSTGTGSDTVDESGMASTTLKVVNRKIIRNNDTVKHKGKHLFIIVFSLGVWDLWHHALFFGLPVPLTNKL